MSVLDHYRLWSQSSAEAHAKIAPAIPWQSFNKLSPDEKKTMLLHFKRHEYFKGEIGISYAVNSMNSLYKKECYAKHSLENWTLLNVLEDFRVIFLQRDENIVYELISLYGMGLIVNSEERVVYKVKGENNDAYEKRVIENAFEEFDKFQEVLNDIFEDYKINVHLTRLGFVPQQDNQIIEDIYDPVLQVLSFSKWGKVNRELKDAFEAYGKSTPDGYSECMTHCYSAVQALLQEIIGKNNIGIKDANKAASIAGLIPNDAFSNKAFAEILSTFEQLRMQHGDAHVKQEYASEKSAKLMLNLTMVYLQHCLPVLNSATVH